MGATERIAPLGVVARGFAHQRSPRHGDPAYAPATEGVALPVASPSGSPKRLNKPTGVGVHPPKLPEARLAAWSSIGERRGTAPPAGRGLSVRAGGLGGRGRPSPCARRFR